MNSELAARKCVPCEGGIKPMNADEIASSMQQVSDRWQATDDGKSIVGHFTFKNYFRTSSFVAAVVWIAHSEDHHPSITFDYKTATITYNTHAIGGLSDNDFICAAKIDALVE